MTSMANNTDYFEFWVLDADGMPKPCSQRINTDTGVILNCHPKCDAEQVRHLCAIARQTRDYPVDISAWAGAENDRHIVWSARIFWRSKTYGRDKL